MNFRVLAVLCVAVSGCGPTLDDLPRLSDQDVANAPATLNATPNPDTQAALADQTDVQSAIAQADIPEVEAAPSGGLLGLLRRARPSENADQSDRLAAIAPRAEVLPQSDLVLDDPSARATVPVGDATPVLVTPSVASARKDVSNGEQTPLVNVAASLPKQPEKPKGLFGLLRQNPQASSDPAVGLVDDNKATVLTEPAPASEATVQEAAVVQTPVVPKTRRGLFAPRKPSVPTGPDALQVPLGASMPYGDIARVCGVGKNKLGREIGRFPDSGRGYRLYDSAPGSTGLRPHYITGFSDGCVRQFSAALALFGGTEFHEQVRYQKTTRDFPYTPTDLAYEKLKSKVCRVGTNTPCPPSRISKLQKDTVFVTVYERFGNNPRWADILLHDGSVLAKDIKSR